MDKTEKKAIFLGKSERSAAESTADYAEEYLREKGFLTEWVNTEKEVGKLTEEYLKKAELLISFEQAGFGRSTQSGSFLYNILPVKSIHFMGSRKQDVYERLKGRKVSLALFFLCQGMNQEEEEELQKGLPNVPWLYACRADRQDIECKLEQILSELYAAGYGKSN